MDDPIRLILLCMVSRQLELGLGKVRTRRQAASQRRHRRGHQWFELMRQAVDGKVSESTIETETLLGTPGYRN
jgi:hypothetical protein